MTKSQLREAIRQIVKRKLNERFNGDVTIQHDVDGNGNSKVIDAISEIGLDRGTPPKESTKKGSKYAYFTDKTKKNVMLIGYGQMTYDALKAKLIEDLGKMQQLAKQGNHAGVVSQWENITKYAAEGLKELEQPVTEEVPGVMTPNEPAVQMATDKAGKQMSQADQNKINTLEADKAKAQQELEKTKGELAKKTKPYTDKINKLEKKVGDTNTAIERIRA